MEHSYWNNSYAGWGWFLWFGIWFLIISSFGNWGYTYRVHRRFNNHSGKNALELLNERYAQGKLGREEYHRMKQEIAPNLGELDSGS